MVVWALMGLCHSAAMYAMPASGAMADLSASASASQTLLIGEQLAQIIRGLVPFLFWEIVLDIALLIKAAVMGVVEGLTEFLPISSTGHLILAGALLGFDDEKAKVFDIAIQTGAIFAVILVYWQKIRKTLVDLPTQRQAQQLVLNVLIAFLPAVLLGLLFGKAIKAHLFTPVVVATTFIVGGFIILWAEKRQAAGGNAVQVTDADDMT
jgi:undecaprenyl-diphosphatase